MKKYLSLFVLVALFAGCNPAGEFRDLIDGGSDALSKEDSAYRQLKMAAQQRGEGSVAALHNWVGTIYNLKAVMADAQKRLQGSKEAKIRANKDVQTALSRFKQGIDEVLGRNYGEAALSLVPPWKMQEAQSEAASAASGLKQVSSYYEAVFAMANSHVGKDYSINVREDAEIYDTYQACVSEVEALARGQAKSSYCVNAARAACGHQTSLGCVQNKVRAALADNMCPDVRTMTYTVPADEVFRPQDHVNANTEELKDWKYGHIVTEPNPDRVFSTFCPAQEYDRKAKAVLSTTLCGFGPKVRIYGYDENRHVLVEVMGVHRLDGSSKGVMIDMYADGNYLGTHVMQPDFGWNGDVYSFTISERAFQPGSVVKLQFRNLVEVTYTDDYGQPTGKKGKAHWVVEAQIRGEDVPFIHKREVFVTKYTPNSWISGIVNSCQSSTPVLK